MEVVTGVVAAEHGVGRRSRPGVEDGARVDALGCSTEREGEHEENVLVLGSGAMAREGGRWMTALVLQGGRGNGLGSHAAKGKEKEVGEEMGLELG